MDQLFVALANDYEIVLEGLRALLARYASEVTVVEAAVGHPPRRRVDITFFDTYGAESDVEVRVAELAVDATNGHVVVFSFSDNPEFIDRVLAAGAHGFIAKSGSGEQIMEGLRAVARGERVVVRRRQRATLDDSVRWPGRPEGLTERESELLALLPSGISNRELAQRLFVSENTVKSQLRGLFAKLGVRNRTQAATMARGGLLGVRHTGAGNGAGNTAFTNR